MIHFKRKDHLTHLIALLKALIRNRLKISPRKCQLFRQKLTYMGQTLLIKDNTPCITPLRSRVGAIQRLEPPKTPKECKKFCGLINYLAMYLKDLQKRLIPIYNLTRKGVPFEWTDEHQKIFEGLKDIANPPVLVMPNNKGHLTLVSDTSGVACEAALYQEQRGKLRLVGYNSKKLPPAAIRYGISELELCGLAVNIHSFKHILRNTEFTVIIDHSALLYILNAKREPPTLRLKKLIEVLSQYSFKVKFLRGKDMTISDFLSRHPGQDLASPNEIIPISFQSKELLNETDICCLAKKPSTPVKRVTRRTEQAGEVAPIWPLTGDTRKPEHVPQQPTQRQIQPHKIVVQAEVHASMEPLEPEVPIDPQKIDEPLDQGNPPPTPEESVEQETEVPEEPLQVPIVTQQPKPMVPEQPLPQILPMPRPMPLPDAVPKVPDQPIPFQGLINLRPLDIRLLGTLPGYGDDDKDDKNQPDVSIIQPDKTMYRNSKKLFDEIQDEMIFRKHLPRQLEINKCLESLKRKVIHDYVLSAEYEKSPFFMDIYKYITKGHIPSSIKGQALRKLQTECEDYLVIDDVLFRIKIPKDKDKNLEPSLLLVIPESYVLAILYQYHD